MSEDEYQIFIQQRFHTDDLPDNVHALKILRYHYDIGNACPYVDFWHYMMDADFPLNTKQVLTKIKLREMQK